jgi:hypothetical protein
VGAARSLIAARREWWATAVSRRLAAAWREQWGTAVSRRLTAGSASGGLPGSSHEVAGSTEAVATPQPTGDVRRRQIHPPDPLTYPREQTHATARAARLLKKTRRC